MPYVITSRRGKRQVPPGEISRLIRDEFPTKYVIFHSVILTLISIALIAIQIILLVNKAYLSNVSTGLWCAAVNFLSILMALLLLKNKTMDLGIMSWAVHLFSYIVSLLAVVFFMIALIEATETTESFLGLYIAGLVLSIIASIFNLIFFIYLPCGLMSKVEREIQFL